MTVQGGKYFYNKNIFYSFILFSIYYCICDGGDANRQLIKINFPNCSPIDLHFIGYNMWTEEPMIFQMDCKGNWCL